MSDLSQASTAQAGADEADGLNSQQSLVGSHRHVAQPADERAKDDVAGVIDGLLGEGGTR